MAVFLDCDLLLISKMLKIEPMMRVMRMAKIDKEMMSSMRVKPFWRNRRIEPYVASRITEIKHIWNLEQCDSEWKYLIGSTYLKRVRDIIWWNLFNCFARVSWEHEEMTMWSIPEQAKTDLAAFEVSERQRIDSEIAKYREEKMGAVDKECQDVRDNTTIALHNAEERERQAVVLKGELDIKLRKLNTV